jgi:hypothetical protein
MQLKITWILENKNREINSSMIILKWKKRLRSHSNKYAMCWIPKDLPGDHIPEIRYGSKTG